MENNSDICGIVSSIVLDCFLVHHKNKNFGAYTQILDTIRSFKIEFLSLFLLGHNVKTILNPKHHVVGQSVNPRFGATLSIDAIL